MSEFIETLRMRQQAAHRVLQVTQQKLALVQAEHTAATHEFNAWNYALVTETRKAQQEAAAIQAAKQVGPPAPAVASTTTPTPMTNAPEVNKTDLVRGVLRHRHNGITPNEIFNELKSQVGNAYIYSILKRLKDRDEVAKKRGGKYYLKHPHQPEEVAAQNGVVQQE